MRRDLGLSPAPRPSLARRAASWLASALVLAAAAVAAILIWDYYVDAPWTRDGRIRAQVASVAPQVSGQITQVRIVDNQYVRKGDVLYVIDRFNFENAVDGARSQLQQRAADLQVKKVQAERRERLTSLSITAEEQQVFAGSAVEAQAGFKAAQAQLALAEVNLARTAVVSPVNGFVNNLLLRVGDYAREGVANVYVVDADSYWVDGYFEETKMSGVCVGDAAEVKLMGYPAAIRGVVETVTRGISVADAAPGTQGLPRVDPVYTWVRLAQRVPVRIRITDVPDGVPLVSGMTATVTMRAVGSQLSPSLRETFGRVGTHLAALFDPPRPRAGCVPKFGIETGATVTIATPRPAPALTPDQINPGLDMGLVGDPR